MGISHDADANAGGGGEDTAALAAHEAYKSFRKFQELCDRLALQAEEMKAELDFGFVDNRMAVVANVTVSTAKVFFKKAKRKSSSKVGPAASPLKVLSV